MAAIEFVGANHSTHPIATMPGHRFNVADLELALSKQRQVLLHVTFANEDFGHAVLLRDLETAANGRKTIRLYGWDISKRRPCSILPCQRLLVSETASHMRNL